jgi:hypothetical protein
MFKTPILFLSLLLVGGLLLSAYTSSPGNEFYNDARDSSFPLITIKARGFKGTPVITENHNFKFLTGLENDHYFQDSSNRFVNFYLETRLTNARHEKVRVPLNIATC